jgi:16S rRNA (cytidine1402-2'-O)-methyltransferase
LSVAGLPSDRFCFEGFLPAKTGARRERLVALRDESRTLLLFESVHRIKACIQDIDELLGSSRKIFVGRELTKMHEQCIAGTAGELLEMIENGSVPSKGEFVIAVQGANKVESEEEKIDIKQLLIELLALVPGKQAVAIASRLSGRRKNEIYQLMLTLVEPGNE